MNRPNHSARKGFSDSAIPLGIRIGGATARRKRIENAVLIGFPLVGTVFSPFWLASHSLTAIEISAFLASYLFVGLGVSLGLHRYFSHKSFEPKRWIVWLLAAAGTMAFQGSILRWVADHRRHHAHADECGDVHSPVVDSHCANTSTLGGLFHAHIGWMFDDSVTDYDIYATDLLQDPLIMFFQKTYWLWPTVSLAGPWFYGLILGGLEHAWSCLLVAGCFRTTLLHNAVWAVNSFGHSYGYETFPQENKSKNNPFLALLTFGDGWHNNHHRFPRSAFHGLSTRELDVSGLIITLLERLGQVRNVIRVPPNRLGTALGAD